MAPNLGIFEIWKILIKGIGQDKIGLTIFFLKSNEIIFIAFDDDAYIICIYMSFNFAFNQTMHRHISYSTCNIKNREAQENS